MKAIKLQLSNFRLFNNVEIFIGKRMTAIAGNNGTGKSTVLGLLANSSQLKGKKTLLGKPYIGEFSQLFRADKAHDPTGQKVSLIYEEKGARMTAEFRTAWQGGDRFRVIPKRKRADGSPTESKIESPVIYLGLSRLFPVGESVGDVTERNRRWKNPADGEWFNRNYSRILSIHEPIKSVSSLSLTGIASKSGTGVETGTYGPIANSSGQDNLGQILLSVLSLKTLREEMGPEWDGGLLVIDEVDAALHPAAQLRLIKLLLDEAKSSEFQVVFTTHSTVVLEDLSSKNQHNTPEEPGDVEVVFLSNANGPLQAIRNPSWSTVENGLFVTNPAINSKCVGTFTEDEEARWFVKGILDALRPDVVDNIDLLDVSLGCEQIVSLYVGDFSYFRNRVVVFDGDFSKKDAEEKIPPALMKSGGNIVFLPGGKRPESVLWDYLSADPGDGKSLWADLDSVGITWASLVESPPESMFPGETERNSYKKWLRKYERLFERAHVVEHWVEDNLEDAQRFSDSFLRAYNIVAKRLGAPELPMAKKN